MLNVCLFFLILVYDRILLRHSQTQYYTAPHGSFFVLNISLHTGYLSDPHWWCWILVKVFPFLHCIITVSPFSFVVSKLCGGILRLKKYPALHHIFLLDLALVMLLRFSFYYDVCKMMMSLHISSWPSAFSCEQESSPPIIQSVCHW